VINSSSNVCKMVVGMVMMDAVMVMVMVRNGDGN
jgi:hypothetical protein